MLLNLNEILEVADREKFAIPAFNISSWAMFNGIMDISERKGAPVIIEIHPNELKHVGTDFILSLHERLIKSPLPTCLHLDHANFGNIMSAIRAGFTSVMIDGSSLPFDENVAICKKVVECAHQALCYKSCYDVNQYAGCDDRKTWHYVPSGYVSVEGELGNIGTTDEDKAFDQVIHYTQPDEAVKFIKATGIDALAIAIGTCHGIYPDGYVPQLKLDLLREIHKAIRDAGLKTALVLHGGSNNPDSEIAEAARSGIAKINISSDIKVAYYQKMREVLSNKKIREPNEIEPACIQAMIDEAAHKIDLFGAADKAKLY